MSTAVRRKAKFNPVETFRQHIAIKGEAATLTTRSEALKKRLKDWFSSTTDVYENENGSKFFDFPETVEVVPGTPYKGMELRRSVSTKFDEDVAEAVLTKKGVLEEALSTYIDQDKVYLLVQQGKITEKDIDKMFSESETFAFWPVKGEVY